MTQSVYDKLEQGPMFDMAIVEHHFTPYMRDYDIIVEVSAFVPNRSRAYIAGRYLYRFTHCVLSEVTTAVRDETWACSWDNVFLDYQAWEAANCPSGYVWGVCWIGAYPGLSYIDGSSAAHEWSERLGHPMHEVYIETNAHNIRLIFHDVEITKVAYGNAQMSELVLAETVETTTIPGQSRTGAV